MKTCHSNDDPITIGLLNESRKEWLTTGEERLLTILIQTTDST